MKKTRKHDPRIKLPIKLERIRILTKDDLRFVSGGQTGESCSCERTFWCNQ